MKRKEYTEDFEKFWAVFKGRWDADQGRYVKPGKYRAALEWQTLTTEEKILALRAAPKVHGKYVPDPCRWLKYKRFDDYETAR